MCACQCPERGGIRYLLATCDHGLRAGRANGRRAGGPADVRGHSTGTQKGKVAYMPTSRAVRRIAQLITGTLVGASLLSAAGAATAQADTTFVPASDGAKITD